MPQNFYELSEYTFAWLEGAFERFWTALTTGALDFILHHWIEIFLVVGGVAFVIDQALYYAKLGKEAPLVRFFIRLYELCEKVVYKIAGKPLPEKKIPEVQEEAETMAPTRAAQPREAATIAPTQAFTPAGAEPVTEASSDQWEALVPEQSVRLAREDEVQQVVIPTDFVPANVHEEEMADVLTEKLVAMPAVSLPEELVLPPEQIPGDVSVPEPEEMSITVPVPDPVEMPVTLPVSEEVELPIAVPAPEAAEEVPAPEEPTEASADQFGWDEYEEEPVTTQL